LNFFNGEDARQGQDLLMYALKARSLMCTRVGLTDAMCKVSMQQIRLHRPTASRFIRDALFTAVALFVGFGIARADPIADCNSLSDPKKQIRGCTQVIAQTMVSERLSIAYMNRGIAYAELNQRTKALADFSAAINADNSNSIAYYNRGNIYFDMRKLREAAHDYSSAIELESDMAPAFANRGLVNEMLGEREASIADYRAALALDPTLAIASAGLKRLGAVPHQGKIDHPG
jgi:tetratricopeptide (TPR) repeat protein